MADFSATESVPSLGILGGGRGGTVLFDFFISSRLVELRFVVDPNVTAPAVVRAKERGLPTFTNLEAALRGPSVDFVVETTGLEGFEAQLAQRLAGTRTRMLTHGMARLMVMVMEEHRRDTQEGVTGIVRPIQAELATGLDGIQAIVGQINQVMGSMQMLALNASIEAAKAGRHGRGFAVVADQMGKSVETVRGLTQEIEAVNRNIHGVAQQIEAVLEKLK
ncbi:MAG: hypothetical protein HY823_13095 [Acidobacteria bacterium]|nr:hypothetical protein [Acidobacteriota bacterium]